jgi:hypothetical protein
MAKLEMVESEEAKREILETIDKLCAQPLDYNTVVQELDYIIRHT